MKDKENIPSKTDLGGIGRAHFIQENEANIEKVSRDISGIDRQEGNMDPGTKGGNFDQDSFNENQEGKTIDHNN
jgi:hypothetical protein